MLLNHRGKKINLALIIEHLLTEKHIELLYIVCN